MTTTRHIALPLLIILISGWAMPFAPVPAADAGPPDRAARLGAVAGTARSVLGDSADDPSSDNTGERSVNRTGKQSTGSSDEQLLKDLDAGDEPSLPARDKGPAVELGSDADPLTRIGTKMRAAETLIDREKLSAKTTQLQGEIVHDIDELIKTLRKKMQQQQPQQSSLAQAGSRSQSGREKIAPPPRNSQSRPGERESKEPARDSENRVRRAPTLPKIDSEPIVDVMKRVWGDLPQKDREQMRQAAAENFIPKYYADIEKYFRRLAEGDETQH